MKPNNLLTAVCILLLHGTTLMSASPNQINYHGRLTDEQGGTVTGNLTMVVRIYDAPTGGNLAYEENIGTVAVSDGDYNFSFGSAESGILNMIGEGINFLALTVNGAEESLRTRLLLVPVFVKGDGAEVLGQQVNVAGQCNTGLASTQSTSCKSNTTLINENKNIVIPLSRTSEYTKREMVAEVSVKGDENSKNPCATGIQLKKGQMFYLEPNLDDSWCGRGSKEGVFCNYMGYDDRGNKWMRLMYRVGGGKDVSVEAGKLETADQDGSLFLYAFDGYPEYNLGRIRVKIVSVLLKGGSAEVLGQ